MDVKKLRESIGLTQQELADISGIPRDRIAKWEQEKGNPKSYDAEILTLIKDRYKEIKNKYLEINDDQFVLKVLKYGFEVKKLREKLNMTIEQLGAVIAISPIYINLVELGLSDTNSPESKRIYEWAGIDISKLPKYVDLGNTSHNLPQITTKIDSSMQASHGKGLSEHIIARFLDHQEILIKNNEKLTSNNEKLVNRLLISLDASDAASLLDEGEEKDNQPGIAEIPLEDKRKPKGAGAKVSKQKGILKNEGK